MSIKVYPKNVQHIGGFNDGEIIENKPFQLSDDGKLQPYSNLFYWAHASSEKGSTISEHPHKVFEILSFVIEGEIEHYDTKNKKWIPLKAGDVQIIRSGSGISHSEKLGAGAVMFQIWFDPDISKTINQPATYNDYPSDSFRVLPVNGTTTKFYTYKDSPLEMDTPGVNIFEARFKEGSHRVKSHTDEINSVYVIDGEIEVEKNKLIKDDFFVIENVNEIQFIAGTAGRIFVIQSPAKVPYQTYVRRYLK